MIRVILHTITDARILNFESEGSCLMFLTMFRKQRTFLESEHIEIEIQSHYGEAKRA